MSASKWTEFAKEQPPEGHGAIYVTDGTRVSLVKRLEQPFTEGERWVLAEPEANSLKLAPQVLTPTHWAVSIPGLPKVSEKDMPEAPSAGGPPPVNDPEEMKDVKFPEQDEASLGRKVKVEGGELRVKDNAKT